MGLILAAWSVTALGAILFARRQTDIAARAQSEAQKLRHMLASSPAIALVVHDNNRIEVPERLRQWLGLDGDAHTLDALHGSGTGILTSDWTRLCEAIAQTRQTAAPFDLVIRSADGARTLTCYGGLTDLRPAYLRPTNLRLVSGRSVVVWMSDFTTIDAEQHKLHRDATRWQEDFEALLALIEAAPLPMWYRAADGSLRLVNSAYVEAVDAASAEDVIAAGTELIEPAGGRGPRDFALEAATLGEPAQRKVLMTIAGERRACLVTDIPLSDGAIAGYSVDIEALEELSRTFRAFRKAQRSMLDHLSAGVAQFDAQKNLTFANHPFTAMLSLDANTRDQPGFADIFDCARDAGRLPEVRDYPAWKHERLQWFSANAPIEEAWPLANGSHLRVIAQPTPDGGLLLIVEDRTEQLHTAAMRDTLLRTRAATFDGLFESVAVFSPDGRLNLWNRRFAKDWEIDGTLLDSHPHIEDLLHILAPKLALPDKAATIQNAVRTATLERRDSHGEVQLVSGRTLEYAGVPLPDGNGLLLVLDTTANKEARRALQERNTALERADAIRGKVLADVVQAFRTPLDLVTGYTERLDTDTGGALNPLGKGYLREIALAIQTMTDQVEQLSRLAQEERPPRPQTDKAIAISPLVEDLVKERKARLDASGITLQMNATLSPVTISGDTAQLTDALAALIDNAIDASQTGTVVHIDIAPLHVASGKGVRILIADEGHGIDQATLARALAGELAEDLADKQTDPASAKPHDPPPVTVRLAKARAIVEAHDGRLDVFSEPGHGTTTIAELP